MHLYLLRHGLTWYNEEKRYQGVLDSPLSAAGRAQLRPAAWEPAAVYVSPLRRARETADILFPRAAQTVVEDLREMSFGDFEGHTYQELTDNPDYEAWLAGNCLGPCPGGESKEEFCARTCAAVEGILEAGWEGRGPVVILAHGGTQMAVMEKYARPRQDYYSWHAPCGGGYLLEWTQAQWKERRAVDYLETVAFGEVGESC